MDDAVAASPTHILIGNVAQKERQTDPGLQALAIVARVHQIPLDVATMAHELGLGGRLASGDDIVRAARQAGLKARRLTGQPVERLEEFPRPAILHMGDGSFFVLNRASNGVDTLRDPLGVRPRQVKISEIAEQWQGEIILIAKRAPKDESQSKFGLRWFLVAASRYRNVLFHVLICSFFIQLFALTTPLFFQIMIDKVLVHKSISTLEVVVGSLAIIGIFDVGLQYLRSYAIFHTASRIDVDLGAQMFVQLFRLPVSYFESRATGQTVARVREVETIRQFLTGQAMTAIIDVIFTILFFAALFYYSVNLTLIICCTIPLYILVASVIRPLLREKIQERFNRGATSQQYLVESVVGAVTLKAAAVEPILQQQWEERLAAYVKTSFQATMLSAMGQMGIQYVSKLTTVAIMFWGATQVFEGRMTLGQLIAFNMISNQVISPILRLSQLWQDVQQIQVSVDRLGDVFNYPMEESAGSSAKSLRSDIRGSIAFENVTFRYRAVDSPALAELSLKIPEGQVVGIVGASGSGKSTLTKLVQRLYVPEKGRVLIDGVDISQVHPAWFRRQIGVVLQENILFNRTVHENIAIACPGMSRAEVLAMARLAGAHEFIQKLPQGYDTQIQERGANLSGGQRQRIAIARALANKPRILIFDEATSALDYESEQIIQANMRKIVQGRTVIIVAHRLAAVRDCDRIIAMSQGLVVEDGTHSELLQRTDGIYSKLWKLQTQVVQELRPASSCTV